MSDKAGYEKQMMDQFKEWQSNFDKLKEQAESLQGDQLAKLKQHMDDMRAQRDDMEKKMSEVQKAQMEAWTDVKKGADKAWDDMSKAMTDAWKRFT